MKIGVYVLIALLSLSMVMAAKIDYKARCDWTMPATQYRPERVFHNIGIYGSLSDGSLVCFIPGDKPKVPVIAPAVVVAPVVVEPVCEDVETCEEQCEWDFGWYKKGHQWKFGWHEDCEEVCTIEKICEKNE